MSKVLEWTVAHILQKGRVPDVVNLPQWGPKKPKG